MSQIGFFHDMTRCTGCKACQVACKDKNDLDLSIVYRHAETYERGNYPTVEAFSYSFSCNHCATPACVTVCPTGAFYKSDDDGSVLHDDSICTGCQTCVSACPYGVPKYNAKTNLTNKCDACYWVRKNGGEVACASTCPSRALYFGDIEELQGTYGSDKDLVNQFPALGSAEMTMPSILINLKPSADNEDYRSSIY